MTLPKQRQLNVAFAERRWFPCENCFLNKKAKIEIHQGVNKSKVKSETTNPSNFAFIQFRCWQRAIFPGCYARNYLPSWYLYLQANIFTHGPPSIADCKRSAEDFCKKNIVLCSKIRRHVQLEQPRFRLYKSLRPCCGFCVGCSVSGMPK